jgi:hypothetical protein
MVTLHDASGTTVVTGQGTRVVLGKLIKSGGAGSVYRMRELPAQVAKLYHPNQDHAHYERKVAAMLELTPQLPDLSADGKRIVQIAWPQTPIRDTRGRFMGFLMPAVDVDATSELECILQEKQARREGLPTGLGPKVTLAANLSAVIAELHRQRHYVVDLKPVNLRFYRQALYMAMLDCDGFSIQGKGERFDAPQYTPDYLAPEFHARTLTAAGEAQQDRFALAVVVFQLLNFGIHPFTGRPASEKVPTDIPSRIAGRWYAYGLRANRELAPVPSSGHATMPPEVRHLFDRAFESTGGTRPPADEWAAVLREYAQRSSGKVTPCARNHAHQHFAGLECAQCGREKLIAGAHAAAATRHATRITRAPTHHRAPGAHRGGATGRQPVLPPAMLAALQKRWKVPASSTPVPPAQAKPATRTGGRPANWPAPPPPPAPPIYGSAGPAWGSGTPWWMNATMLRLVFPLAIVLMIAVFGGIQSCNDSRERAARAELNERLAAAEQARAREARKIEVDRAERRRASELSRRASDPSLLVEFQMSAAQVAETRVAVQRIAGQALKGDAWWVERNLRPLREGADARRARWGWMMASTPPTFAEPGREGRMQYDPDVARLRTTPLDTRIALALGWRALDRGQVQLGEQAVLQAIWADPDNADAWFTYGLLGEESPGAGAMAVALLLYPSHDEFVARVTAGRSIVEGIGLTPDQYQTRVRRAHEIAIALAPNLPQDSNLPGQAGMLEFTGAVAPGDPRVARPAN